jgi:hypothetical protein
MALPNRNEILRIDCTRCRGNGYITTQDGEEPCPTCGGVGQREKKVPWKPEGYSRDEVADIFGVASFTNRPDRDDPAFNPSKVD